MFNNTVNNWWYKTNIHTKKATKKDAAVSGGCSGDVVFCASNTCTGTGSWTKKETREWTKEGNQSAYYGLSEESKMRTRKHEQEAQTRVEKIKIKWLFFNA